VTKTYADTLEERTLTSNADSLTAVLIEMADSTDDEENALPMGWALRQRAQNVRFSSDVHEYLKELFNQGASSGKKIDPKVAAKK
jgi:hypothetical protein